jgi:hypothetical protein
MEHTPFHVSHISLKLALVLVCLITTTAYAWPPSWANVTSSTGSGDACDRNQCDDLSIAIKVGPDGSQYVTGRFSGTLQLGGATLVSAGGLDIFVAKFGPFGKLRWIVQAGGSGDDGGTGLDLDRHGNVYVTGGFTDTATFGSTNGASKAATGIGSTTFLAKYTCSGHLVWVQTGVATFSGVNNGFALAVNPSAGTVYISAGSQGDVTFSSANGSTNIVPGVWTWHMVLAEYDTSGNFLWGETNEAGPNSLSYGVASDANDNAYVTGWLEDTATFFSHDGNDITVTGFSPAQTTGDFPGDAFLAKYDKNGNVKWVNHIGGYIAHGSMVAVGPNGNVTVVGYVGNINYGSPGEAETIATSQPPGANRDLGGGVFTNPYNLDLLIVTYNCSGALLRAIRRGNGQQEAATGVTYDSRGNLYVTGVFQDPAYAQNLFVAKFPPHSLHWKKLLWKKIAPNAGVWVTNNTVMSPAIAVGPNNRVFVTGAYQGTATFGRFKLNAVGAANIFLAELAQD